MPGSTDHNNLTPMNYLKIVFRRKEYFIIPAFFGLVFGICTGILLPKQYAASAVLLVEEGKSDNPLFQQLAVSSNVLQRLSTIKESMLGWNSLLELVKRLKMAEKVKTPQDLEQLILGIRKRINLVMRGRNIIYISYLGEDPELTRDVVKTITEIFIERNIKIQNKETSDAIRFIEEQLKLYKGKIKSSEIAQLKDQLKILLVDSTEKHPRVQELKEQIAAKEKELKEEKLEYTDNYALGDGASNALIEQIKQALDKLEGPATSIGLTPQESDKDFYKVMLIDKLDSAMARDVNVNNSIYMMLLQRLETAKITQRLQTSKEGTRYTVLDPPRVPLHPTKPNRVLVALFGLFCGGGLGVALIFFTEFFDKSFIDVEEAKQFLGVPLLGAISKIDTEANIRRRREKIVWLYTLTIIAGIVIVLITKAAANFMQ